MISEYCHVLKTAHCWLLSSRGPPTWGRFAISAVSLMNVRMEGIPNVSPEPPGKQSVRNPALLSTLHQTWERRAFKNGSRKNKAWEPWGGEDKKIRSVISADGPSLPRASRVLFLTSDISDSQAALHRIPTNVPLLCSL